MTLLQPSGNSNPTMTYRSSSSDFVFLDHLLVCLLVCLTRDVIVVLIVVFIDLNKSFDDGRRLVLLIAELLVFVFFGNCGVGDWHSLCHRRKKWSRRGRSGSIGSTRTTVTARWEQTTAKRSQPPTASALMRLSSSSRGRTQTTSFKESSSNRRRCILPNLHNTALTTFCKAHLIIIIVRGSDEWLHHSCSANIGNQDSTGRTEVLENRPMGGWRWRGGKENW
jgi:hypothetical protein